MDPGGSVRGGIFVGDVQEGPECTGGLTRTRSIRGRSGCSATPSQPTGPSSSTSSLMLSEKGVSQRSRELYV